MEKLTGRIGFDFIYDAERRGAHYSLNGGESWMNGGEFAEIADKFLKGYELVKDACTPYDKGSDLGDDTSVKSSNATLVNKPLGYDFESFAAYYFATVHSSKWDWVIVVDNEITVYTMNEAEFKEFLQEFGYWDKGRKVIRFRKTSFRMIMWLEEKAGLL